MRSARKSQLAMPETKVLGGRYKSGIRGMCERIRGRNDDTERKFIPKCDFPTSKLFIDLTW